MEEQQANAPEDVKNVVIFLRSRNAGIKVRVGALNGRRVDYFKGKSAIKALLSPAYAQHHGLPKITSEAEALTVLSAVRTCAFFLHVHRGAPVGRSRSSPKLLQLTPEQTVAADGYYAWVFEGSQWSTYAGALLLVLLILGGALFPVWPLVLRLGVYYLSMSVLTLVAFFLTVRLVFYLTTVVVVNPGIWLFPNLFADVGFVESFIPFWEWAQR
ncbi:Translocation protein [Mycena venus]|uniref:Translocation protein SEC62 n=1 Tax=Mycena venus TaxID=2733690 RepID=A0A8H7CGB6_9AGAR|nr:Translocation protein [Mycena venus]